MGDRKDRHKKRDSKPRRGSDSSLVGMSQDFEFSAGKMKKRKKKKKFSLNSDNLFITEIDGDVTPPPSPSNDALFSTKIDEVDEESDDSLDSNHELEINDNTSDNRRVSKHSSIDSYTKVGSKSNSKDISLIAPGNQSVGTDFDPDIDVADYEWTSYGTKTTLQPTEAHSDYDNVGSNKLESLSPKNKGKRPQSARTPSPQNKNKKNEKGFFAPNKKSAAQKKKKKKKKS